MKKYSQSAGAIRQRTRRNELKLAKIIRELDIYGSDMKLARGLVQGRGTLGSAGTTRRLKKISAQIKSGKFNIRRRVANNKDIKSQTNNINPDEYKNMSAKDIIASFNRSEFYREHREDIRQFNEDGRVKNSKLGRKIREDYTDFENEKLDILSAALD